VSFSKSNAVKVGLFTLLSLGVLFGTVYWLKSREFQQGLAYSVSFPDVDGLREGAPVQLMGTQVGYVEKIIPQFDKNKFDVDVQFRLASKDNPIPKASVLSIEQSGLISEKLLEITPPHLQWTDVETAYSVAEHPLPWDLELRMKEGWVDIGTVEKVEALQAPPETPLNKKKFYLGKRLFFRITRPGVLLPEVPFYFMKPHHNTLALRIDSYDAEWSPASLPAQGTYFTVETPLRLKKFLQASIASAEALKETNDKINALLDAETIVHIQQIIENVKLLSGQTTELVSTTQSLLKTLKQDIHSMVQSVATLSKSLTRLMTNINTLVNDPMLKDDFKGLITDLRQTVLQAQALISSPELANTFKKANLALDNVNNVATLAKTKLEAETLTTKMEVTLSELNTLLVKANQVTNDKTNPITKEVLQNVVKDATVTLQNLKQFSQKLQGHFVLWKLAF
jgi:hypothetical protein